MLVPLLLAAMPILLDFSVWEPRKKWFDNFDAV